MRGSPPASVGHGTRLTRPAQTGPWSTCLMLCCGVTEGRILPSFNLNGDMDHGIRHN